jgi:hypothetical protein
MNYGDQQLAAGFESLACSALSQAQRSRSGGRGLSEQLLAVYLARNRKATVHLPMGKQKAGQAISITKVYVL